MPLPRLYVSFDADLDWLTCLELGLVDDGQPPERWSGITDWLGLHVAEDGRIVGFKVPAVADVDLDHPALEDLRDAPRFDTPQLGLDAVTVPEIIIAALAHFAGESSVNRLLFDVAVGASGDAEILAWRRCLQSGDAMAHFGLGVALLERGEPHGAYRHLRHYAHLAPAHPWNWCWYGAAAWAIGETGEARDAFERAVALDDADPPETDARERLAAL